MAKGLKNSVENMYNRMIAYSVLTSLATAVMGVVLYFLAIWLKFYLQIFS